MKRINRWVAVIMAVIIFVGIFCFDAGHVQAATKAIYLSSIGNSYSNTSMDDIIIYLDTDKTIDYIDVKGSVTFKGNKTLTVNKYVVAETGIKIESGASVKVNNTKISDTFEGDGEVFCANGGNVDIAGSLDIVSSEYGISAGADSAANVVNISGNVNVSCVECAIWTAKAAVNINGGNVSLKSKYNALRCRGALNVNGGKIEAEVTGFASENDTNVMGMGINIADGVEIKSPENGKVADKTLKYDNDDDEYVKVIVGVDGKEPLKVVIEDKQESVSGSSGGNSGSGDDSGKKYSSEWISGKWYNADGSQTYGPTLSWKYNGVGWWVEDSSGWYPTATWQKIDSYWYYFHASGYMASGEWVSGWWLNDDGSCTYPYAASWRYGSGGWWYGDESGWYATGWQKIDGYWYYFSASGYMVTNQTVDGCWLGADGAWR